MITADLIEEQIACVRSKSLAVSLHQQAELIIFAAKAYHRLAKMGIPNADLARDEIFWTVLRQGTQYAFTREIYEKGKMVSHGAHKISDPVTLAEMIETEAESSDVQNSMEVQKFAKTLLLGISKRELSSSMKDELEKMSLESLTDVSIQKLIANNRQKLLQPLLSFDAEYPKFMIDPTQPRDLMEVEVKTLSDLDRIYQEDVQNKQNAAYYLSKKWMIERFSKSKDASQNQDPSNAHQSTEEKQKDQKIEEFFESFSKPGALNETMDQFFHEAYKEEFKKCYNLDYNFQPRHNKEQYQRRHQELFDSEIGELFPEGYRNEDDKTYLEQLNKNEFCKLAVLERSYQEYHQTERTPSRLELKLERDRIREQTLRNLLGIHSEPLPEKHRAFLAKLKTSRNLQDRFDDPEDDYNRSENESKDQRERSLEACHHSLSYVYFQNKIDCAKAIQAESADLFKELYFEEKLRSFHNRPLYEKPESKEKKLLDLNADLLFVERALFGTEQASPIGKEKERVEKFLKKIQLRDLYIRLVEEALTEQAQLFSALLNKPYVDVRRDFDKDSKQALIDNLAEYGNKVGRPIEELPIKPSERDNCIAALLKNAQESFLNEHLVLKANNQSHDVSELRDPVLLDELLNRNMALFNRHYIRLRLIKQSPALRGKLAAFSDDSALVQAEKEINDKLMDNFFVSLEDPKVKNRIIGELHQRIVFHSKTSPYPDSVPRNIIELDKQMNQVFEDLKKNEQLSPGNTRDAMQLDLFLKLSEVKIRSRLLTLMSSFQTLFMDPLEDDSARTVEVPLELREFLFALRDAFNVIEGGRTVSKLSEAGEQVVLDKMTSHSKEKDVTDAVRVRRTKKFKISKWLLRMLGFKFDAEIPLEHELLYLNDVLKHFEQLEMDPERLNVFRKKDPENIFMSKEGRLKVLMVGFVPIPLPSYKDYKRVESDPDAIVESVQDLLSKRSQVCSEAERVVAKKLVGPLAYVEHAVPLFQYALDYTDPKHKKDKIETEKLEIMDALIQASFAGKEPETWIEFFGQKLFGLKDHLKNVTYQDILSQIIHKFIDDGRQDINMAAFKSVDVMIQLFDKLNIPSDLDRHLAENIAELKIAHEAWLKMLEEVSHGLQEISDIEDGFKEGENFSSENVQRIKTIQCQIRKTQLEVANQAIEAVLKFSSMPLCRVESEEGENPVLSRVLLQIRPLAKGLKSAITVQDSLKVIYENYLEEKLKDAEGYASNPFSDVVDVSTRIENSRKEIEGARRAQIENQRLTQQEEEERESQRLKQEQEKQQKEEKEWMEKFSGVMMTMFGFAQKVTKEVVQEVQKNVQDVAIKKAALAIQTVKETSNERINTGLEHLTKDVVTRNLTVPLHLLEEINKQISMEISEENANPTPSGVTSASELTTSASSEVSSPASETPASTSTITAASSASEGSTTLVGSTEPRIAEASVDAVPAPVTVEPIVHEQHHRHFGYKLRNKPPKVEPFKLDILLSQRNIFEKITDAWHGFSQTLAVFFKGAYHLFDRSNSINVVDPVVDPLLVNEAYQLESYERLIRREIRKNQESEKDSKECVLKARGLVEKLSNESTEKDFRSTKETITTSSEKVSIEKGKVDESTQMVGQLYVDCNWLNERAEERCKKAKTEEAARSIKESLDNDSNSLSDLQASFNEKHLKYLESSFDREIAKLEEEKTSIDSILKDSKEKVRLHIQETYTISEELVNRDLKENLEPLNTRFQAVNEKLKSIERRVKNSTPPLSDEVKSRILNQLKDLKSGLKTTARKAQETHIFLIGTAYFFDVIKEDDLESFKKLLLDEDEKDQRSLCERALYAAAQYGSPAIIDYILSEKLADVKLNSQGESPLHVAVKNRKKEAVRFFVKHQQGLNLADSKNQETALHWAVRTNDRSLVYLLVQEPSIDSMAKNSRQQTPYDLARESKYSDSESCLDEMLNQNNKIHHFKVELIKESGFKSWLPFYGSKTMVLKSSTPVDLIPLRQKFVIAANRLDILESDLLEIEMSNVDRDEVDIQLVHLRQMRSAIQCLQKDLQDQVTTWKAQQRESPDSNYNSNAGNQFLTECEEKVNSMARGLTRRLNLKIKEIISENDLGEDVLLADPPGSKGTGRGACPKSFNGRPL